MKGDTMVCAAPDCDNEYVQGAPNQKYCPERAREHRSNRLRPADGYVPMLEKECNVCHKIFPNTRDSFTVSKGGAWSSDASCRLNSSCKKCEYERKAARKPIPYINCAGCGKKVVNDTGGKKYCDSLDCRPTPPPGVPKPILPRDCIECGKTFMPDSHWTQTCSDNCRQTRANRAGRNSYWNNGGREEKLQQNSDWYNNGGGKERRRELEQETRNKKNPCSCECGDCEEYAVYGGEGRCRRCKTSVFRHGECREGFDLKPDDPHYIYLKVDKELELMKVGRGFIARANFMPTQDFKTEYKLLLTRDKTKDAEKAVLDLWGGGPVTEMSHLDGYTEMRELDYDKLQDAIDLISNML